jgi:hypothetical protein
MPLSSRSAKLLSMLSRPSCKRRGGDLVDLS